MKAPCQVVVADDQMISRGYMEYYVRARKDYQVAAVLNSAQEALAFCREKPPDLLIMDIMMKQGIDGLSAAEIIKREHPEIKIILATSLAESRWLSQARAAGVESFWFKESSELPLQDIMDRTMAGESVYGGQPPNAFLGEATIRDLSPQQMELLRYLTEGYSDKEIGKQMGVESSTVRTHMERLMKKTGIHSRTELAVKAGKLGLTVSDQERMESIKRAGVDTEDK